MSQFLGQLQNQLLPFRNRSLGGTNYAQVTCLPIQNVCLMQLKKCCHVVEIWQSRFVPTISTAMTNLSVFHSTEVWWSHFMSQNCGGKFNAPQTRMSERLLDTGAFRCEETIRGHTHYTMCGKLKESRNSFWALTCAISYKHNIREDQRLTRQDAWNKVHSSMEQDDAVSGILGVVYTTKTFLNFRQSWMAALAKSLKLNHFVIASKQTVSRIIILLLCRY